MAMSKGPNGTSFIYDSGGAMWHPPTTMMAAPEDKAHTIGQLHNYTIHIGPCGATQCCGARSLYMNLVQWSILADAIIRGGSVHLLHFPTSTDPNYTNCYLPPIIKDINNKYKEVFDVDAVFIGDSQWVLTTQVKDIKAFRALQGRAG